MRTSRRAFALTSLIAFAVLALTFGVVLYVSPGKSDVPAARLPQQGIQKILDVHSRLYASNEDLTDMLVRLDVFFKNQNLNSDVSSPDFKPETGADGQEAISTCVEFKYFSQQDNKLRAAFTLIPRDPKCYTREPGMSEEISQLYTQYRYVYAAESF